MGCLLCADMYATEGTDGDGKVGVVPPKCPSVDLTACDPEYSCCIEPGGVCRAMSG